MNKVLIIFILAIFMCILSLIFSIVYYFFLAPWRETKSPDTKGNKTGTSYTKTCNSPIKSLDIWHGADVDGIVGYCNDGSTITVGYQGGSKNSLEFPNQIDAMRVGFSTILNALKFEGDKTTFGQGTLTDLQKCNEGDKIIGFKGTLGSTRINSIAPICGNRNLI